MFLSCFVKAGVLEGRASSTALARSTAALAAQTRSSNNARRASSLIRAGTVGSTKSISISNHQRKNSVQIPLTDSQLVEQTQLIDSRQKRNGVITQAPLAEEVSIGEISS